MLNETISVGTLKLKNRLVMPPMATGKSAGGIVTDDLLEYYRERAVKNGFGLIITEHSCITEAGRASKDQLSISADERKRDCCDCSAESCRERSNAVYKRG